MSSEPAANSWQPIIGAYAWGGPLGEAQVAASPADFRVDEILGFDADHDGPHLLVQIEKAGLSTQQAIQALARHWQLPARDIGYAGRKDRQAITRQWLTLPWPVNAPLPEPQPVMSTDEGATYLALRQIHRHRRKLRVGALLANDFTLTLRGLHVDPRALHERLVTIALAGVPNYFGPQRFGRGGRNLAQAARWLIDGQRPRKRNERSLLLSAARSESFNRVLDARVRQGDWQVPNADDWVMLDGRGSVFPAKDADAHDLVLRAAGLGIHATGPLPGQARAGLALPQALAQREQRVTVELSELNQGLEREGVEIARRALRLRVGRLSWYWPELRTLELSMRLTKGAYATTVLRELVTWSSEALAAQ